ncbi:MAG: CIA30 family protein [Pseudomonadota bacterium]
MLKNTTLKMLALTVGGLALMFAILPTVPPQAVAESAAAETTSIEGNTLAFDNLRVFTGNGLSEATRVVVRDGVIDAIGSDAPLDDLPVIDGNGATLLPGLIDAHTHSWASAQSDALRFGVTAMLDMFTAPGLMQDATAGRNDYTRTDRAALFSAGMLATAPKGHGTQFGVDVEVLEQPEQAAGWVARRKAEGSDYIKLVYIPEAKNLNSLDLPTAAAVIEAAHAEGLMAVAHISAASAAEQLIDAGIDGLVHVYYDEPANAQMIKTAAQRNVFVIPTLAITSVIDGQTPGKAILDDTELAAQLTGAQRATLSQSFGITESHGHAQRSQQNVTDLHAAGVTILAGSDAPNPSTAHGITLHQEMELLVQSGLSPVEALQAATSEPARIFGLEGRGRIEVGARADLLLVDGDPTQDIRSTRNIVHVLRNGYIVDRAQAPAAPPAGKVPSALGAFEDGIDAPQGYQWTTTADDMMGGASSAAIEQITPGAGGSNGALSVRAENKPGFPFPWAGAYLAAQGAGDLSGYSQIRFDVRGTPARYRLMLFAASSAGAPPTVEFDVTEQWQQLTLSIDDVAGFEAEQFIGLAFTSPTDAGSYEFALDNIVLLP